MNGIVLALILPAVILCSAHSHLEKRIYNDTPFYAGRYAIYDCSSKARAVKQDLNTLRKALQPALANVNAAETSGVFELFFKDTKNKAFVKTILQNVANGTGVIIPESMEYDYPQSPVILCRNRKKPPASTDIYARLPGWRILTYEHCRQNPHIIAVYNNGNANIALCDRFWARSFPSLPPDGSCFTNRGKTSLFFEYDGAGVAESRVYALLHEIVHYYVEAATQSTTIIDEPWLSGAMALGADEAIHNAGSYVLYVYAMAVDCLNSVGQPRRRLSNQTLSSGSDFRDIQVAILPTSAATEETA